MQKSGPGGKMQKHSWQVKSSSGIQDIKLGENFHGLECLTPTTESDKGDSKDSIVDTGR